VRPVAWLPFWDIYRTTGNWKIRLAAGLYFKREWCRRRRVSNDSWRRPPLGSRRDRRDRVHVQWPDWTFGEKLGRDNNAAIGCWLRCAGAPTRATSTDCYSIPW